MKQNLQFFISERAENLAMVYLSRSHSVAIERMQADYGIDLLVTILLDRLPTGRVFGVQVKGQDKALKGIPGDTVLKLSQEEKSYLKDLPFPVCALFFTMEDDKGYSKWLRYPTESSASLYSLAQTSWRSLDEFPVDRIVKEVNAWYDEKSHSAA